MKVDHVSIAWSNLSTLEKAFESIGLKSDYGGVHSNGITHMSLLAFDDGSYIELISVVKSGPSPSWGKQVAENGGPCAWAVEVPDIKVETERVRNLGVAAVGPNYYNRKRPDGVLVEWELSFIGDKEPGATLPFLIKDKTPRSYRVKPSPSVSSEGQLGGSPRLIGVDKVILGVEDLEEEAKLFRKVYGWREPLRGKGNSDDLEFRGTSLAEFDQSPVVLVSPDEKNTWMGNRLEKFGDSPCAFLIGTSDLSGSKRRYGLSDSESWIDGKRKVAWIPSQKLNGIKLGFIG